MFWSSFRFHAGSTSMCLSECRVYGVTSCDTSSRWVCWLTCCEGLGLQDCVSDSGQCLLLRSNKNRLFKHTPGTPNHHKEMDVSPVPAISYVISKGFDCRIGTTNCFWLGLGFQAGILYLEDPSFRGSDAAPDRIAAEEHQLTVTANLFHPRR